MTCPVIELAQQLIKRPSLSPNDEGCQQLMIDRLHRRSNGLRRYPKLLGLAR